eukprot:scaffold7406_cov36-Phaeocystis_antarctica.AAC.1
MPPAQTCANGNGPATVLAGFWRPQLPKRAPICDCSRSNRSRDALRARKTPNPSALRIGGGRPLATTLDRASASHGSRQSSHANVFSAKYCRPPSRAALKPSKSPNVAFSATVDTTIVLETPRRPRTKRKAKPVSEAHARCKLGRMYPRRLESPGADITPMASVARERGPRPSAPEVARARPPSKGEVGFSS